MRRKDREIKNPEKINQIISSCNCIRLGFNDDGQVYIVPLNFGYCMDDGKYIFYFHGAKEGRKIQLIQKSPYVGFEMVTNIKIKESDMACNHSASFQSVIGNGYVCVVDDFEEKKIGLSAIMKNNTEKGEWQFSDTAINSVCVFKMIAEQLSCKEHE